MSDPVILLSVIHIQVNFTVAGYNNTADPIDVPINTDITFSGYAVNYTPTSYNWHFADGSANCDRADDSSPVLLSAGNIHLQYDRFFGNLL